MQSKSGRQTNKRHESLIPLSREHHYALMLCLRITRGLPIYSEDWSWLEKKARVVAAFFDSELAPHFEAEEQVLFPAIRTNPKARVLIAGLVVEHREIQRLARVIRSEEASSLAERLKEFAHLLEAHIRKEERQLFPIYEREVPEPTARQIGLEILAITGPALEPKNPALLEP